MKARKLLAMPVEIKELVIQARMKDEQAKKGTGDSRKKEEQEAPAVELTDEVLQAIEEVVRRAIAEHRVR